MCISGRDIFAFIVLTGSILVVLYAVLIIPAILVLLWAYMKRKKAKKNLANGQTWTFRIER
jgi:predicted membrane protein